MHYAIELHFDAQGSAPINALAEEIQVTYGGAPLVGTGWGPHITLTVFDELPPAPVVSPLSATVASPVVPPQLAQLLTGYANRSRGFTVQLAAVGLFPGEERVVYLAPIVTEALLALHRAFHRELTSLGVTSRRYYRPERWVPHCTVAFLVPAVTLGEAANLCRQSSLPLTVTVRALRLIAIEAPATDSGPPLPVVTELAVY
ncbi:MAG TPA: 2'-5' RNA ligase family protein [Caldilineaceae bacterium]|nr:2'-5' RNA ligase family protein [Caldilineaceae bacterium]